MGVGTNDPSTNLHVVGGIRATTAFDLRDTSGNIVLFVEDSSNDARISNQTAGEDIIVRTTPSGGSATERLRISANGNIGIGGIAGDKPLHVRKDGETYPLLLQNRTNSSSRCGMALIATGSDFGDGQFASIEALSGGAGSTQHELQFKTCTSGGTPTNRFTIRHDGNVRIPADNAKLQLGASEDFELYHDGTDNVIQTDGPNIRIGTAGENFAKFVNNGTAELYYDNSKKLETKSDGVDITGELQCDTLDVDGDADFGAGKISFSEGGNVLDFADNIAARFGTGNDLRIYHDGTTSIITGDSSGDNISIRPKVGENGILLVPDGAVTLYHDDSAKLATSSSGITVTGAVTDSIGSLRRLGITAVSGTGNLSANDAGKLLRSTGTITLTIPSGTFTAGDMISIFNVGTGTITIAQGSSTTLYNSADASTGNRALAAKGLATIACTNSNEFVISGSQLS
jgi:hypothetical protein|tara:strand:- start:784 stop:2157 length:1374 start_codon:yes stop_codon:yes gene_type:complete